MAAVEIEEETAEEVEAAVAETVDWVGTEVAVVVHLEDSAHLRSDNVSKLWRR